VRRASKRLLPLVPQVTLLVRLVSPKLGSSMVLELSPGSHTTCFITKTNVIPSVPVDNPWTFAIAIKTIGLDMD
jgi:hypothetical protein